MKGREKMLSGPDVIEVPVREEDRLDPVLAALEAREIRDEVIDPKHVFLRELKSEVDQVDIVINLDDETVSTDLLKTAERIDAQARAFAFRLSRGALLGGWARRGGARLLERSRSAPLQGRTRKALCGLRRLTASAMTASAWTEAAVEWSSSPLSMMRVTR
jgi:hypothetical protein